jgi:serine/threonine protein kinase
VGTSETLRSVIDAGRTTKRLDELTTARVIGKIAEQLHAAHQKAGAGKAIGPIAPTAIAIASTGALTLELGPASLGYSSPELTSGGTADRRSDVFSLGVVMWEALTHQRLFDAMNDAAVKVAIQGREIASPSELNANIPAELSAICMRALARTPADRYQSAKVMAVEIEEFLNEAGYADNDELLAMYVAGMPILRDRKSVV